MINPGTVFWLEWLLTLCKHAWRLADRMKLGYRGPVGYGLSTIEPFALIIPWLSYDAIRESYALVVAFLRPHSKATKQAR